MKAFLKLSSPAGVWLTMNASTSLAAEILETIPALMGVIRNEVRRHRTTSLSVADFRVLLYVNVNGGTGLSPIADHVGFSVPSASRVVERLLQDGLLRRETFPEDRRRVVLTLTEAGSREIARARDAAGRYLGQRLDTLDAEAQEEMTRSLQLLRKTFAPAPAPAPALHGTAS